MFLVKVLEKKGVIQTFGLALVLAPIVNTLVKMAMLTGIPNRWSFAMFWRIIAVGSVPNQILYVATIIIGILMLRGTTTVWKYALMLLGGYILLQLSDFKHVKSSAVTWMFFITNILAFMFVADQLVWKVKASAPKKKANPNKDFVAPKAPAPAMKAAPKPAYRVIPKVRKKILFQFAGRGPWGQLMGISSQGIHVRGLAEPPPDIATREIEISLNNGLTLRTRLARRKEHDYYFDYTSLSSEEIKSLNKWLHSLSDVA
ncbi:MAG: hypothetical protein JSU04_10075 [Bdellovibrionales bacterium]|nr:hypothetical protein [Bdellovibrionales bacterium]